MSELTRTTLAIEKDLLEKFDQWMASRGYDNRSEAVRDLVRSVLVAQQWQQPSAKVVASLSIVFDHSQRTLAQELTSLQHELHHAVLCSQHVHLDEHLCLETILLRGRAEVLRKLSDAILATRGVKTGKLTLLSENI